MNKNARIFWTIATIAIAVLCLASIVATAFVLNNYLGLPQEVAEELVTDEPVIDEPVIDEPVVDEPVVDEPVETIGSNSDPDKDTYFPELSCSHLPSCQISKVPEGYFTIGYKDNGNGCDWLLYEAGETIDYSEIDEFHTYNQLLPLTKLEGFVAAQFQYVLACTINN